MITSLLTPDTAPLKRLSLYRICLSSNSPNAVFHPPETERTVLREALLYPLIGHAKVFWNNIYMDFGTDRSSVKSSIKAVYRAAFIATEGMRFSLVKGKAFDALLVLCDKHAPGFNPPQNFTQRADIYNNLVGEGTTHERIVREVISPPGVDIQCGETLNIAGGWSSFPAHATPKVAKETHADHEEVFFVVTPGMGHMFLDGWYCDGSRAEGYRQIPNNTALVTPLGSHPIVFSPGHWGWYFWAYASKAIKKTYNRFAHECGLREYVE